MAKYRILIKASAAKEIERIPNRRDRQRVIRRIRDLADEKISADTFQLFTFPWEMAICAIRHKEWQLTTLPEDMSIPNMLSDKPRDDQLKEPS